MKGSDNFKANIQAYLEEYARENTDFQASFNNPLKSIESCISYILGEVSNIGKNAFADSEIYDLAVNYYIKEEIKISENKVSKAVSPKKLVEENQENVQVKKELPKQDTLF